MPAVNFVLSAFESAFTSAAATVPSQTLTLTTDATLTLSTSVSQSVLQNTFFFRADQPITSDASFVYYYVDKSAWSASQDVLNPKNAIVTANGYAPSDNVSKDFIRDLAKQLFGTYLGADMFTNEDAVVTDINTKCDAVALSLQTLISSIDKTSGSISGILTDASGAKYLPDDTSASNISREMLNQIFQAAPSRFASIQTDYLYHGTDDGYYRMPILSGDTITFMLTITPASGQAAAVLTGKTQGELTVRKYTVILNVSA